MGFKRIIGLAICLNLAFSQAAFAAVVPTDVLGQSYEEAVTALFERGIITGDEKGEFHPNQTLTRAQACIIVVKSMNPVIAEVAGTATQEVLKSGFPDMSGYAWAEGYISYAVKKGVTKGYPDGTFKPGNRVSSNELITMVLRGAGYQDHAMTGSWPTNYKELGETLDLYVNLPTSEAMPDFAAKWMAAQMGYNALPIIDEATRQSESPSFGIPKALPDMTRVQFVANGSFDVGLSSYAGMTLADQVQVYIFGEGKDYVANMTLSNSVKDYLTENVYKYKRVITPGLVVLENGKISSLIIPKDVGYSGTVYGVINGTTRGFSTLTAAREINWAPAPGIKNVPSSQIYSNGTLFKLKAMNGKIVAIEEVPDMEKGFNRIEDYKINGPVKIGAGETGRWVQVSATATVYRQQLGSLGKYSVGSTADIRTGSQIKFFDVSDDDETRADLVLIKE